MRIAKILISMCKCPDYDSSSSLCLPVSSADNVCKQFGPRSGSKLFDILIVFLKDFFQKVNFEKKTADDKKAGKITQHAMS